MASAPPFRSSDPERDMARTPDPAPSSGKNDASAATLIAAALSDLADNAPAERIMSDLRSLDPNGLPDGTSRAAYLHARGIASNRLGLPGEALGDLHEARTLFHGSALAGDEAAVLREIARVYAWRGDGRGSALALLSAISLSGPADHLSFGRAMLEAGRLNREIGCFDEAIALISRALAITGDALPPHEVSSASLALGQTLLASGRLEAAREVLLRIEPELAAPRTGHLVGLEMARIAVRMGRPEAAADQLQLLRSRHATAVGSFSDIETIELEAEIDAACSRRQAALDLIRQVVERCAEDELGGREVLARMQEGKILADLDRPDEALRTRLVALQVAVKRGLVGYADMVRGSITRDGQSPATWLPGMPISVPRDAVKRFVRRRPLGEGGFGSVSKAYDLETGREVALKRLCFASVYDPSARDERLDAVQREVSATSRIAHPGIARVHGILAEEDGDIVLVRELVEGPTLREAMAGDPPLGARLAILGEIAQAVSAVHRAGVVHGDLKPENIILRERVHPVIIDFGASVAGPRNGSGGSVTIEYAAPEQLGGATADRRADLYALATLAFEMFTGHRPARGGPGIRSMLHRRRLANLQIGDLVSHGVPPSAAGWIARALALRPRSRPRNADDLVAALGQSA